ncbi:hypothetical protein [Amycolatopsis samaneae]|uniref:Uncharacterized protein n=1 Tax=Amycolatopsis samaneae TaxID=664691 RepID=A0ABW5GUB6_9PSEU
MAGTTMLTGAAGASADDTMNWEYRAFGSTVDKAVSAVQALKDTYGGTRCTGVAASAVRYFGFDAGMQCQIPKSSSANMLYWSSGAYGSSVDSAQAAALEIARRSAGPGATMCASSTGSITVDSGFGIVVSCWVAKIDGSRYMPWVHRGAGSTLDSAMNSAVVSIEPGDRMCTGVGAGPTRDGNWSAGIQCYTPK